MPSGSKRTISGSTVVSKVSKVMVKPLNEPYKLLKITLNLYYGAKIHNGSFFWRLATRSNADTMFIKTRREFTNVCTYSDLLAFVQESMLKLTLPI